MKKLIFEQYEKILSEKILDMFHDFGEIVEIYVNPSYDEWKKINAFARVIVTKTGDLYVVSNLDADFADTIHIDILGYMINRGYISKFDTRNCWEEPAKNLLALQRDGMSMDFYTGESYDQKYLDEYKKDIDRLVAKVKQTNPHVKINTEQRMFDD